MADNVTLNSGTGGATLKTDELADTSHVQYVKLMDGTADGTGVIPGDATNGLLVNLGANNDVTVTGTVTVDLGVNNDVTVTSGTVTANLAAGTNNIGDVDVLSVVPGTGATSLGKAVDDVAGATDTGIALLAVRDDSLAALTPADGDYTHLRVSSTGALHVTGGGGGTEYNEDVATPATITGTATMMERDDALSALTPIEGDWASMRCDANGALWTAVNNTVSVSDGGGSITIDGTVTANAGSGSFTVAQATAANLNATVVGTGTFAVQATVAAGSTNIAKAEDTASADADVGVPAMAVRKATPANTSGLDGDYEMLQMSAGRLWTSATIDAALPAGTNAIGKLAANSGVDIGDVDILSIAAGDNNIGNVDIVTMPNVTLAAGTNTNEVVGDVAHDVAVAGNPVRIAGRAVSADYTSVATGDTADLITTLGGKLVIHPYAIPENYVSGATSDMTATTSTSVVAAAGAGLRNYITNILVQNSHATVGTWVNIQDGSGGTTLYTVYAAAAGGGASITLPCPIKTTANTALFCANVTTGANTRVSASGYKAP